MIKLLKKYKLFVLIVLFEVFSVISYAADNKCEQIITVKYMPYGGVKVYTVSGSGNNRNTGKDKRGIIDLGHFSGIEKNKKLNIGTVEVTIEMLENSNSENKIYEVELVDINKLQNYIWSYTYEVTSFIGEKNNVSAKVITDNFKLSRANNATNNGIITFNCNGEHQMHAKYLNYRFDLILELNNLTEGGMYGFSPKRSEAEGAYINIKDIVVEQLKGSTTANGGNN